MAVLEKLRTHWPEYLIEGWALDMFMISAGVFTLLFEYPGSPLQQAIVNPDLRRGLIGLAMGLTAVGLIYSRWGKQSGAHMNPAVTLTFLRLGKIEPTDALFYILAQFLGGTLGVLLVDWCFGAAFEQMPVNYVVTVPGAAGHWVAFMAEVGISLGLMLTVLLSSNSLKFANATGLFAGVLVASYIALEAPLSGMSMNPARSFASAVPAGQWSTLWLYFSAPLLGMLLGAEIYLRSRGRAQVKCAKLQHPHSVRCIHCGHEPVQPAHTARGMHSMS